ncbi:MAG: Uma2 family endonuclease [Chloroflexota bacterium]|nr:Uma2 family endonuclease [Chloroflexota bacterium]
MATQERVYTADDVWQLEQQPLNPTEKYYLIDGELMIKMAPTELHGDVSVRLSSYLFLFVDEHNLGRVTGEVGFHPPGDRGTALLPDVAFTSKAKTAQPARSSYVPYMPDLAVEIISPSQTLAQVRRKAEVYLRHGAAVVWLLDPLAKTAEVWRRGADDAPVVERIAGDGDLTGGDILPGFRLPLARIFSN